MCIAICAFLFYFFSLLPVSLKCCVCMVSDFFYPNLGGIETHIFELSKQLVKKGFKVIIVTNSYNNRHGIRWMANGIKVYYLPFYVFIDVVSIPNIIGSVPLCRNILFREKVDIVHGHQVFSQQFILHAKSLNIKTIYTDHSLYSFSNNGCIHVNKILKHCMLDVDHSICVSHTNRENLVLRTEINPYKTSVISNALDSSKFIPCISKRPKWPRINIIVISRLTERKVFLLGKVNQKDVINILQRGHIFLNTSLTE
uniref:PIGA GPI anchor biosynthesis domain-containing protein n=1 Tax=Piliocolobus tephrosceles TaxID=591936 RepID=A0A8C9GMX0_9PRIM